MERRKALAVSAVVALLVAGMVVMAAALVELSSTDTNVGSLAPADLAAPAPTAVTQPAPPVVEYLDVYETVPGATSPAGSTSADARSADTDSAGGGADGASASPSAPAPATRSLPSPTTDVPTAPATTTTTRPPGVPADWPADKPIPPMPEGCQKPQLEDDGVWNCDH